jgi:amino acid transporter
VTCVFTFITAAVIAEACSASPTSGSIYLWAAEAGGKRFGCFFGFIVAWWSTTAWTTFCASMLAIFHHEKFANSHLIIGNTQSAVNYMLSVKPPQPNL